MSQYHQLCCCDAFPCDCASYQVRCGCFTQNNIEITYRQTVYLDTVYGSFLLSESRYTMRTLDPATVVGCLYRKWPRVEIEYESTEHDLLVKGVISNSTYPPGTFPPECIEMCDGCDLTVPACTLEKIGIVTNKTWTSSGTVINANEDGEILRLVCFGYCACGCPPCPRAMVRYTPEDKFILAICESSTLRLALCRRVLRAVTIHPTTSPQRTDLLRRFGNSTSSATASVTTSRKRGRHRAFTPSRNHRRSRSMTRRNGPAVCRHSQTICSIAQV